MIAFLACAEHVDGVATGAVFIAIGFATLFTAGLLILVPGDGAESTPPGVNVDLEEAQ